MTENLKYLERTLNEALKREADPDSVTPSLTKTLFVKPQPKFGFAIPDDVLNNEQKIRFKEKRLSELKNYRDSAAKLDAKLHRLGIKPIAVITTSAWDAIVKETGLFRLEPSHGGRVWVDVAPINELHRKAHVNLLIPYLTIAGTLIFGSSVAGNFMSGPSLSWVIMTAVGLVLAGSTIPVLSSFVSKRLQKKRYHSLVTKFLQEHTWDQILEKLSYGDERFFPSGQDRGNFTATIELPEPPHDVALIINKLAADTSSVLMVAAEAGAIQFKGGVGKLFDEGYEFLVQRDEDIRRDPIIYIKHFGAVAIVAQYGDFVIEREVIDRVVNSEHLL